MSHKRTRKQKQNVKYPFLINWQAKKNEANLKPVKSHFASADLDSDNVIIKAKNADLTDKAYNIVLIKRDITKSLIIVSLILALETVIYFAWH